MVLCVLCAALPARPGFPSGRADLYEEEHGRNIRMHVYTYALRGGEVYVSSGHC